jgi:hypothetical protein
LKVHLFSLSPIGTTFSWFSSLSPNSIGSWEQLEHKFHDHLCSPKNELKLLDLTLIRQGRDESVNGYIRRFRDTKNQCFNLTIGEKVMDDLSFNGLCSYLLGKLDGLLSLLSHIFNKELRRKKAEARRVREILNILAAILIMLIMILTVLVMNQTMFMQLNFVGLPRLNLSLVTLSSQFTKIGKWRLNLLLM